jgi:hypothetical protein
MSTDVLARFVRTHAGSLEPPTISAADFDVRFITPVATYAARFAADRANAHARGSGRADVVQPLQDFANWEGYVGEFLPVLLVRVTPKLAEGFWQAVGRYAARTQGVAIPAVKHPKAALTGLRLYCGESLVTPLHAFRIVHRAPARDGSPAAIQLNEGLFVFGPDAVTPACGTATVVLFSDRRREGDARPLDAAIVDRIVRDFELSRTVPAK